MNKITVRQIMSWRPCSEYPRGRVKKIIGSGKTPLDICALDLPARDLLWVLLRPEIIPEMDLHQLSCTFAAGALPLWEKCFPDDRRPRIAIETKRKWVAGESTSADLAAAWDAAWAAARAAGAATGAAAGAAARAAAWAAARAAAWDAAWAAAWAAAWTAARDAGDAARDAAWAAARVDQLLVVRRYLERGTL